MGDIERCVDETMDRVREADAYSGDDVSEGDTIEFLVALIEKLQAEIERLEEGE